jgi:hypothetical protein
MIPIDPYSFTFEISSIVGLLLAYDIYRPVFSETSSYIVGTVRNNEHFLWTCTGIWVVCSSLIFHLSNDYPNSSFLVRRIIKFPHPSYLAISPTRRHRYARRTFWIRVHVCLLPQLLFRDPGVGYCCRYDRKCCWYVRYFVYPCMRTQVAQLSVVFYCRRYRFNVFMGP